MIYLIVTEDKKYCKIGCTSNIELRLKNIQTSCPIKCNVAFCVSGGYELESILHKEFYYLRTHGEWFLYSGEVYDRFKNITPPKITVKLRYDGLMKNNFLLKADRVGVYRLLGYILGNSNMKYTWVYSSNCLDVCGISKSTYNNYMKQLIKIKTIEKKDGIFYLNKDLFHLSYKQ